MYGYISWFTRAQVKNQRFMMVGLKKYIKLVLIFCADEPSTSSLITKNSYPLAVFC
ncbi:MAG: hypothetical protein K0S24_115 [Sphingobacterium sp.]|jgi:hypothetical protein|nr:hypothetical protein [Sphingobacterium sp.]